MSSKWKVRLECGHWAGGDLNPTQRDALLEADEVACRHCAKPSKADGTVKDGGRNVGQSMRRMEAAKRTSSFRWEKPARRRDGLMVFRVTEMTFDWWCFYCDGGYAARAAIKGHARTVEKVEEAWVDHTGTLRHREKAGMLSDEEQRAVEARKLLLRKPAPPRRS